MRTFAECLFANDSSRKHSCVLEASASKLSIDISRTLVEEFQVLIGTEVALEGKQTKEFFGEFDLRLSFSLE